jgi:hypothetical protein
MTKRRQKLSYEIDLPTDFIFRPDDKMLPLFAELAAKSLKGLFSGYVTGLTAYHAHTGHPATPEQVAEWKREVALSERLIHLIRSDPTKLRGLNLTVKQSLGQAKDIGRMEEDSSKRIGVGVTLTARALSLLIPHDPRLRALLGDDQAPADDEPETGEPESAPADE